MKNLLFWAALILAFVPAIQAHADDDCDGSYNGGQPCFDLPGDTVTNQSSQDLYSQLQIAEKSGNLNIPCLQSYNLTADKRLVLNFKTQSGQTYTMTASQTLPTEAVQYGFGHLLGRKNDGLPNNQGEADVFDGSYSSLDAVPVGSTIDQVVLGVSGQAFVGASGSVLVMNRVNQGTATQPDMENELDAQSQIFGCGSF